MNNKFNVALLLEAIDVAISTLASIPVSTDALDEMADIVTNMILVGKPSNPQLDSRVQLKLDIVCRLLASHPALGMKAAMVLARLGYIDEMMHNKPFMQNLHISFSRIMLNNCGKCGKYLEKGIWSMLGPLTKQDWFLQSEETDRDKVISVFKHLLSSQEGY